jgi:hypothetical protein
VLSLINSTPCRQLVDLGPAWGVEARLDGLDRPQAVAQDGGHGASAALESTMAGPAQLRLRPWELGFWRISAG